MPSLIVWSDASGEHVVEIDVGFQMRDPSHFRERHRAVSSDGTVIEVVTVGDRLEQTVIDMRWVEAGLMLEHARAAGLDGVQLTLYPDASDPDRSWPVFLMQADSVQRDGQAGEAGHLWRSSWTVRRTDGGAFT